MKYTKYILFLFALFFAACNINDDVELSKNTGNKIQLVSRVVPFTQYNVLTRADNAEDYISSLDYIILADCRADGETTPDYRCVYYKSFRGANTVVTIDRDVDFAELKNSGKQNVLQNCIIGVVANYPALYESIEADARNYKNEDGESIYMVDGEVDTESYISEHVIYKGDGDPSDFKDAQFFMTVEQGVEPTVGVPSTGLPRMGNYYDAEAESPIVDFLNLPVGSTCDVNLECLFAKMEFLITVDASQNVAGVPNANEFDLTGYTVTNLVKNVDMVGGNPTKSGLKEQGDDGEPSSNEDDVEVYSDPILGGDVTENEGGKEISFVCYLPERYLQPTAVADTYSYPFIPEGQTLRDEDKKLRQRYKPLLAHEKATYVTLSGVYRNHQGHSFNVDYKIYVGKDNYSNFDVVRNLQYNNNIVIRGIDNSLNQSGNTNDDPVSIDHRVTVTPTLPLIINFRRETLLDAHFEVRPMRIRVNANHASNATKGDDWKQAVKVEVEYDQADPKKDWIGLERSYGDGEPKTGYCNSSSNLSAQGKRLYFTTDLTTETLSSGKETFFSNGDNLGYSSHGGQYVIIPATETNQCVWVYVDECDEESEASESKNATRQAKIKVTNGHIYIGENQPGEYTQGDFEPCAPPIDYIIKQHLLYKIASDYDLNKDGNLNNDYYYIEHEEEYLHNFDSEDIYSQNQTQFKGMAWGLNGVQLSNRYESMYVGEIPAGGLASFINWVEQMLGGKSIRQRTEDAIRAKYNPKYDFYILRDIEGNDLPNDTTKIMYRNYRGWQFNKEIADYLLSTYSSHQGENSNADAKINGIRLDEQPKSAFAYCYNRNKRNANGQVAYQDWYMPSIDELEEIMELAHIQFEDFQGQLYWSCQPAYDKVNIVFEVYQEQYRGNPEFQGNLDAFLFEDDIDRARATRVERENGEFKDVISSEADILGVQSGEISVAWHGFSSTFTISNNLTPNPNFDSNFTNYPGNLPRTGKQCRVRAVRRMTTTQ